MAAPEPFDAVRAWALLCAQTDLGPRAPGSDGHRRGIELIADTLRATGAEPVLQRFQIRFRGAPLALTNVGAMYGGQRPGAPLLLGTHFDTRWRADHDPDESRREEPILGANDGGSGTALMLALAEKMRDHLPARPVQLAFFDGEDLGGCGREDEEEADYATGSERWAAQMPLGRPGAAIVLDLIGGRNLRLNREMHSEMTPQSLALTEQVFALGRARGHTAFEPLREYWITCDHIPFLRRGIATTCLIDLDFPEWHTHADTPDACSREALSTMGDVVQEIVYIAP